MSAFNNDRDFLKVCKFYPGYYVHCGPVHRPSPILPVEKENFDFHKIQKFQLCTFPILFRGVKKKAVVFHQLCFRNPVVFINWVKKKVPPNHVLTRPNAV